MKIIENKYEGHVFPKQVKCKHCGSILELEREIVNVNGIVQLSGTIIITFVLVVSKKPNLRIRYENRN